MPKNAEQEGILQAGRDDFAIYMYLAHTTDMADTYEGRARPAVHHRLMIRALLAPELGHTLILMPRGAGKTAMMQYFIEWSIGRASLSGDKNWPKRHRYLYICHKEEKAADVSLAVMQTIEANPMYRAMFPQVKPSKTEWSKTKWRLAGNEGEDSHPNFEAGGISSPPLGGRFDMIFLDDIADAENMNTQLQRDRVWDTNVLKTLRPMLSPWGRFIMPMTRWHADDPAQKAMSAGWHTVSQKALLGEEGAWQSYWPERFTVEHLLKERGDTPPQRRAFSQQYQNEVYPEDGIAFERWFFRTRFDLLPDTMLRLESWDTASTVGRKSDYTVGVAGVVVAACPLCNGAPWHIFVCHMFRDKLPYAYVKEAMRKVYDRMGGYSRDHYMLVEKKNVGEALAGEGLHEDGKAYPLLPVSAMGEGQAKGTKDGNIRDVTDLCRQGNVHLPSDEYLRHTGERGWLTDFEEGLYAYEPGQPHTDDIVIAFSQLVLHVEQLKLRQQRKLRQAVGPTPWARPQLGGRVKV